MPEDLRTLIVEDDKEASDFLLKIIKDKIDGLEVIDVCATVKDATKCIKEQKPELVLMDVKLKDGNAFEVLDSFENPDFEVVFIATYSEFMEKALKYFPFSYLSKPFHHDEFVLVINRYMRKKERLFSKFKMKVFKESVLEKGTKFLLHIGIEHVVIDLKKVIYCKSDGNYTQFFLSSGKLLMASYPLKHYEKLLAYKGFVRINRFNLININHIRSIYKREAILLSGDISISINVRNKKTLSDLIRDFNSKIVY